MSKVVVSVFGERAEIFKSVFGTNMVCVTSPIPELVMLPGLGKKLIYHLDMTTVTPAQRERLVAHIAVRFDLPADEVEAKVSEMGVPILADECVITVSGTALGLLLPDYVDINWCPDCGLPFDVCDCDFGDTVYFDLEDGDDDDMADGVYGPDSDEDEQT